MEYVFLFPGQGSQSVGMGRDLFNAYECVRKRFAEADALLNRDLSGLVFNGPAEELTHTSNTQPALFTLEAAIADILIDKGITPVLTAGHSLGEYSALYAASVFSFEVGLRVVAKRSELMAKAGQERPGAMAAVLGMEKTRIAEVLATVTSGNVVPANENAPEQTVISGEVDAVREAGEKLKAAGAKKVLPLQVSGAFHSPLMQHTADGMAALLSGVPFDAPHCPVISNVTAQPETDPATLRELLVRQIVSPVRWVDSMLTISANGSEHCVEAGPGSVLKGLARKCNPKLNVVAAGTVGNISSLLSQKVAP
ncbi:MAG: ACP S-malonyltransferase [Chitinispirillaceae bacterium]|nr:ACP S-malonyltransferase [Chitinispirillaceae bacterium]